MFRPKYVHPSLNSFGFILYVSVFLVILYALFLNSFYGGELSIAVKIVTVWFEMFYMF